jgi:hypothetical protein
LFAMIAEDLPQAIAALVNGDGKALPALAEHQRMGDLAAGMWRQAADAWYQRDRAAADALASRVRYLAGPTPG